MALALTHIPASRPAGRAHRAPATPARGVRRSTPPGRAARRSVPPGRTAPRSLPDAPAVQAESKPATRAFDVPPRPAVDEWAVAPSFVPLTPGARAWTHWKLLWAAPWRRFKAESVLSFELSGEIGDKRGGGWFGPVATVPQICEALEKAAYDPRVAGICLKIEPLAVGWGKLQEIADALAIFKASGKFSIAYIERGGEKEYYLACGCDQVFVPPTGGLALRGVAVAGTFLRGTLDKVGVEPEIRRIGEFKSAGDQLLRTSMSDPQRTQLSALVDDVYENFVTAVATARGKGEDDVRAMLDAGTFDMRDFEAGGWVDGCKYADQVVDDLLARTGRPPRDPDTGALSEPLRVVGLKRYSRVSPSAFGLGGRGPRVAVVRAGGAIVGGGGSGTSTASVITATPLIKTLNALADDKRVAAVVLRVDSPGGDALASDLVWRAATRLAARKPLVASMGDVAASGGYYIAMAAAAVVAQPLTLTGSIGVVTGKFNAARLYERVGYAKTLVSKGRYAELLTESRGFTQDESALFDAAAQSAYESFRDRAAASRGMGVDAMQALAQGRVWSGTRAAGVGLVDALGGVSRAVAVAAQLAAAAKGEEVRGRPRVLEVSRAARSPLSLVTGGTAAAGAVAAAGGALAALAAGCPDGLARSLASLTAALACGGGSAAAAAALLPRDGSPLALAPDVEVVGASELAGR